MTGTPRLISNSDGDSMNLAHFRPPIPPAQVYRTLDELVGTAVDVYAYSDGPAEAA